MAVVVEHLAQRRHNRRALVLCEIVKAGYRPSMNPGRGHEKGRSVGRAARKARVASASRNWRMRAGLAEGMNRAEILVIAVIVATGCTVIGMWTFLWLL
jgi:hypothetical protein